jgi:hypothetical protein
MTTTTPAGNTMTINHHHTAAPSLVHTAQPQQEQL